MKSHLLVTLPLVFSAYASQSQELEEFVVKPRAQTDASASGGVLFSQYAKSAEGREDMYSEAKPKSRHEPKKAFNEQSLEGVVRDKLKSVLARNSVVRSVNDTHAASYFKADSSSSGGMKFDWSERSYGYDLETGHGNWRFSVSEDAGKSFAEDLRKGMKRTALRGEDKGPGYGMGVAATYEYKF